jgi:hypothetical protein
MANSIHEYFVNKWPAIQIHVCCACITSASAIIRKNASSIYMYMLENYKVQIITVKCLTDFNEDIAFEQ